ncbi:MULTISPECIES: Flp pilus assembly protein CpaB [unclassified Yoonia]|uniref:Flp pilus assembly protein CpaB n=1 Tax=unclassified Yoonia TaxID=2629118 RepID=UPI002AFDE990|nr:MULTISPECIES: Flp pilus assembly protein CpaB [unclassified Yoonia]
MRAVFGLVLLVGMGLAGFAVYMVNQYMGTQTAQLERARQIAASALATVDVYAAARPITYGEQLTIDDVRIIKYPRDFLPAGTFATEADLFPLGPQAPRVVVLPMVANEVVISNKVSEAGASRGLTALVEPGMRAFPVEGRVAAGFGILRPDDRIDVYWTGRLRDGREVTNLIKSGVQIIAVLGDGEARGGPQSVVLQVSPEDVALLTQAQNSGRLSLALVGAGDITETGPVTIDNSALTGEQDIVIEEAPVVEEARRCFVTQRSGTESVQVEIECSN